MNRSKRGFVALTDEIYWQGHVYRAVVFMHFIPVSMSFDERRNTWTFFGYSDEFEDIPEGADTPRYVPTFNDKGEFDGWQRYFNSERL